MSKKNGEILDRGTLEGALPSIKEWRYLPINEGYSNIEFLFDKTILAEVFVHITEGKKATLIGAEMYQKPEIFTLPIAKVHASNHPDLNPGDFIRLLDSTAGTMVNPDYELWSKNSMNNSSADKVGKEPPKMIDNTLRLLGKRALKSNPLKFSYTAQEAHTFYINEGHIVGKIKDIDKYIETCLED